jgi:hypothetical protein
VIAQHRHGKQEHRKKEEKCEMVLGHSVGERRWFVWKSKPFLPRTLLGNPSLSFVTPDSCTTHVLFVPHVALLATQKPLIVSHRRSILLRFAFTCAFSNVRGVNDGHFTPWCLLSPRLISGVSESGWRYGRDGGEALR